MHPDVPQPGSMLGGKFRVVQKLGQGGMGAVFEAENTVTHKRVAIKWMHPQVAQLKEGMQRLMQEAQASARFSHPNVVDVYDVVREADSVFIVMELLEGEPLTALMKRGGIPVHALIELLVQAMRGVAAAHRSGVVHRDIKPDNIFLAREQDRAAPVPKVLDFGISKIQGNDSLSLTRTGTTMGTPMYMSFEQLKNAKDIDGRTDVYSFGVILYEALTGSPPFEAETFSELAIKIATTTAISPKVLRPEIPGSLARVIEQAMARERDERIPTLDALIRELEPFMSEQGMRSEMTIAEAPAPQMLGRRPASAPPAGSTNAQKKVSAPPTIDTLGHVSTPAASSDVALTALPMQWSGKRIALIASSILVAVLLGILLLSGGSVPKPPEPPVFGPSAVPLPPEAPELPASTTNPSVTTDSKAEAPQALPPSVPSKAAARAGSTKLTRERPLPAVVQQGHTRASSRPAQTVEAQSAEQTTPAQLPSVPVKSEARGKGSPASEGYRAGRPRAEDF